MSSGRRVHPWWCGAGLDALALGELVPPAHPHPYPACPLRCQSRSSASVDNGEGPLTWELWDAWELGAELVQMVMK